MPKWMRVRPDDRFDNEIDLTPMLDVVFIMLIFFIVTATFIRETGLEANRSADPSRSQSISDAISITIDSSDEIWIDGRLVDPRAIRAHIESLRAMNPDWPVVIEPKPASTTRMLAAALDAAQMSDIANVSIVGFE